MTVPTEPTLADVVELLERIAQQLDTLAGLIGLND